MAARSCMSCGENPTCTVEDDCVSTDCGLFCGCEFNDNNSERMTKVMGLRMCLVSASTAGEPRPRRRQYTPRKYEVRFAKDQSKDEVRLAKYEVGKLAIFGRNRLPLLAYAKYEVRFTRYEVSLLSCRFQFLIANFRFKTKTAIGH